MFNTEEFEKNGFAVVQNVINDEITQTVISEIENVPSTKCVKKRRNQIYAIRNLLNVVPSARAVAESINVRELIKPIMRETHIVRAIFFDKIPIANWKVDWHQDL